MTPQSEDVTKQLEPGLWERFTTQGQYIFTIPPLTKAEAHTLILNRLKQSRLPNDEDISIFPFPDNFIELLKPTTWSSPRRLVKIAFYCLAEAVNLGRKAKLPLQQQFISDIENRIYPNESIGVK